MKQKKKRSSKLEARIAATRASAHQEVVASGKIQFRLDSQNMELLLQTADERATGAGVLARMWVIERLKMETAAGSTVPVSKKALSELEQRLSRLEKLQSVRTKRKHA